MGYRPNEQINETLASKLIKNSVKPILTLLVFVGKPVFLLFSYSFLTLSFIAYITGYTFRKFIKHVFNLFEKTAPLSLVKLSSLLRKIIQAVVLYFSQNRGLSTKAQIRKSGIIFQAPRNKLEKGLLSLRKTVSVIFTSIKLYFESLLEKFSEFSWKLSVFSIAIRKIIERALLYLKIVSQKYSPKKYFSLGAIKTYSYRKTIGRTFQLKRQKFSNSVKFLTDAVNRNVYAIKNIFEKLNFIRIFVILKFRRLKAKVDILHLKPAVEGFNGKKILAFLSVSLVITLSVTIFSFWYLVLKDLPTPLDLTTRDVEVSTKIYDRNGLLLYKIYKDENRTPIALEDIPIHVRLATLAIEDSEFYSHPGFSVRGITRASLKNLKEGKISAGGSSITQQLVKNALLTSEKTLVRKLREITLAIQVEMTYTKDEILEMYLNEVSYGGTAYGVQEASRMYFGKDVDKLSLAEAATLAGLPKSPTKFSPYGANPDAAINRQKQVLNLMYEKGFITKDQKNSAEEEAITFVQNKIDIKAPHFVMYVRELLEDKYGKELVEKGGLEVITTLDYQIQRLTESVVSDEVSRLEKLNVTNGAAVVLHPSTGEILAMVGSRDYFDKEMDGNVNVITRLRQPGSSIKIVNYAYALSNGYTPSSILDDSPVTFLVDGQPPYTPKNYEGGYRGKLTLRSALAESRNIPAVRLLASYGVEKMIDQGRKMGITTWNDPKNYGLSLTLGGGEVTMLDLATVYATVANYGKRPNLSSVLKITNYKDSVLEEFRCQQDDSTPLVAHASATNSAFKQNKSQGIDCGGEQVLDNRVAFMLIDILRDNNARAPSFGSNSLLVIPNHKEVAVKTGTSNNLRDNVAIGFNQNYLVAVWVGNNDNTPMSRIASGVTGATPIFNKIMSSLLATQPNHDWQIPSGLVKLPVCPITGTLACSGCPVKVEWFMEENKPQRACSPEWFKNNDNEDKLNKTLGSGNSKPYEGQILPEAARHEIIETNRF